MKSAFGSRPPLAFCTGGRSARLIFSLTRSHSSGSMIAG